MHLHCSACGARLDAAQPIWRCACGGLLDLDWLPALDPDRLNSRPWTLWRYREALPIVDDAAIVSLGEGCTPLTEVGLRGHKLLLKQDHLFPSGSYKDRGASVLISIVKSLGIDRIVEDSSGNAGCAIAAYCAQANIACDIYVPEVTSSGKLAQIAAYGATLHRIPGSREDTSQAVWQAAQGTYYASHSWNPYFFQGTKTVAYEICEQLGWRAPDTVILPVGNGTLLLGAWIGFGELFKAGLIAKLPRLIGVQAEACAPLAAAWRKSLSTPQLVTSQPTLAEGIAIAEPIRGAQILQAIQETDGLLCTVDERQIADALRDLHRRGYYIEPTSATVWAAAQNLIDEMTKRDVVVAILTGHGLKATDKIAHLS